LTEQGEIQAFTVSAHPPNLPRRVAHDERKRWHITCDDGASPDEGMRTDVHAANDGAVRAEGCSLFYERLGIVRSSIHSRPWVENICEHHGWSTKHIVRQADAIVDGHIVLHFDVASNHYVIAHEYILSEGTGLSYLGAVAYMHPMPDAAALTKVSAIFDNSGGVN